VPARLIAAAANRRKGGATASESCQELGRRDDPDASVAAQHQKAAAVTRDEIGALLELRLPARLGRQGHLADAQELHERHGDEAKR